MTGTFRRAVNLDSDGRTARGEVEDDFHHFAVEIGVKNARVATIQCRAVRYPWSSCPMATGMLQRLKGMPIDADPTAIYRQDDALSHCTHMFELAGLVVTQAARGHGRRRYDIAVTDAVEGWRDAVLKVDGQQRLAWRLEGDLIAPPSPFAGKRPMQLGSRLLAERPPEEAEAVLVLRRGVFVANGRGMDIDAHPSAVSMGIQGVCFTFSPGRAAEALRNRGSIRDFTDGRPLDARQPPSTSPAKDTLP